jgi:hypothetical protein
MNMCVGCHRDPSEYPLKHIAGRKRCPVCRRDFAVDACRMFGRWKQLAIKRWARNVRRCGGRVFESKVAA